MQNYRDKCVPKNIDWDRVPLGQASDTTLAGLYGVSVTSVGQARKRRGIPRYTQHSTPQWSFERILNAIREYAPTLSYRPAGVYLVAENETCRLGDNDTGLTWDAEW